MEAVLLRKDYMYGVLCKVKKSTIHFGADQ